MDHSMEHGGALVHPSAVGWVRSGVRWAFPSSLPTHTLDNFSVKKACTTKKLNQLSLVVIVVPLVVVVHDLQEGQLTQLLVVHDLQEGQLTQLLVVHDRDRAQLGQLLIVHVFHHATTTHN